MLTKTESKSTTYITEELVKALMLSNNVSFKTGFLAEEPLRYLPKDKDPKRQEQFLILDKLAYSLEKLIQEKRIAESIKELKVPEYSFDDLSREVLFRQMLIYAMFTHAYFRETLPYKNVNELMQDTSKKLLPAQLAVPLWKLSRITGVAPSMSYGLYSLWNYAKKDPLKELSLDNIEMFHTFSGTLDEKWFVWIHQIVEYTFAPAIPELAKAAMLSSNSDLDTSEVTSEIISSLDKASEIMHQVLKVLEQMRENCNYKDYFDKVRIFYSIPRNIIFEGVEELKGEGQEIYGETGGQTPYMHFLLSTLGIKHEEDTYFPNMQKHMTHEFRNFILKFKDSNLYEYVSKNKKNRRLTRRYNMLVQTVLDWRAEHMTLVDDYIKEFGEVHGTGKPPLTWLRRLFDKTKEYLIEF